MLFLYSEHITPRIEYIFKFILEDLAGFEIKITSNIYEYEVYSGPSINYSSKKLKEKEVTVIPNGFLYQSGITNVKASISKKEETAFLYLEGDKIDPTVFDPFAAAFFLVSRYEEYLPFIPDKFNRFEAKSSVLYKYDVLEQPLVDQWALEIQKRILISFPALKVRSKKFLPLITIDIDQAYAFQHRGFKRNIFAFAKNILSLNTRRLKRQLELFIKKNTDPYDTYGYLQEVQATTGIPFVYFVNVGAYSEYDKNLPTKNRALKELLQHIQNYAPIGIHPSYFSNEVVPKFSEEKKQLESLLNIVVTKSRQHYLKLNFPETYRTLIQIGIKEDYTMGFASHPGFRAGTCSSFYWFDLKDNAASILKIFPTTYMDGSFIEDLQMTPGAAEEKIFSLIETVKKYNGCHVSIWHNHTVSNQLLWEGWKAVFENSLQKLKT